MRPIVCIVLVAFGLFGLPAQAFACRQLLPRNLEAFANAAVVVIEASTPVPNEQLHLWSIEGTVVKVVAGAFSPATFTFEGVIGTKLCQNPQPRKGEKWVVYRPAGDRWAEESYPLDYVRPYDSRLATVR